MANNSMMMHTAALLLLAVVFCSWSSAGAEGEDCCLSTKSKPIPHRLVRTYYMQTADIGCRVHATVFVTKKDKKLCAPLPHEHDWVRNLINKIDNKLEGKTTGKKL